MDKKKNNQLLIDILLCALFIATLFCGIQILGTKTTGVEACENVFSSNNSEVHAQTKVDDLKPVHEGALPKEQEAKIISRKLNQAGTKMTYVTDDGIWIEKLETPVKFVPFKTQTTDDGKNSYWFDHEGYLYVINYQNNEFDSSHLTQSVDHARELGTIAANASALSFAKHYFEPNFVNSKNTKITNYESFMTWLKKNKTYYTNYQKMIERPKTTYLAMLNTPELKNIFTETFRDQVQKSVKEKVQEIINQHYLEN
jgi:hypothetical protein